ncbi:MAG: hypothetical protein DWP98_03340 [Bacteroidetes bacterium]|nr:MAG: hypothetical protein DWP98_03340 [Bacteroidota bacterium]MBL1145438.1 hypothetical protein [Bacteroidota bacterium]NOG58236.1 hypothetical protein [Bacteroidota bacterium]
MNPAVDRFIDRAKSWKEEYIQLRAIILEMGLKEELKWGVPCYTLQEKNVLLIHGFKDYCAILFHKGVLLKDQKNLLIQQTKNVQAARQIRFKSLEEIIDQQELIKQYIFQAIEVEKAGLKVELKPTKAYETPIELQQEFDNSKQFQKAFYALSPGRQRGYLLYFSQAKQSKTRKDRIEKYAAKILDGKGLKD